jgi:predicted nucleic acid-binding protein
VTLVVDASMAVAWILEDEQSSGTDDVMRRVSVNGGCVPSLWKLEVANVVRAAVRAKRCSEEYAVSALKRLGKLQIVVDAETDLHAWGPTRELANVHTLSVYDAAYLELAMRRRLSLATCDGALAKAARRAGVEVVSG